MKKSVIYALCGLLCFSSIITAKATVCTNEEYIELKNIAGKVDKTYEEKEEEVDPSTYYTNKETGNEPVYEPYLSVIFSNITEDIYIKVSNDYNDEVKFIRYQDTQDGIYKFDWKNIDKITKFTYEVYSSTETSCPDEKYYTGYLVLPKYNELSESVMCEGLGDFDACNRYVTSNMTREEQEKKILEKIAVVEEETTKKNKKWYQKIGDFASDYMVIIIAGSIIVIAGVATVVVNKKRKRVK